MDELLQALKAAGEPTRLRILLLLDRTELTVTELCRILGQSQPRVSRHLRLLCDAGLLIRHSDGTHAYFRHSRSDLAARFLASLPPQCDTDNPVLVNDRRRLSEVRADRAELAARSEAKMTAEAEVLGPHTVSTPEVDREILRLIGSSPIDRLLDIGTGSGRMLELLAPRIETGVGVEISREMLNLARTRLEANRLGHCSVQRGNAYYLDAVDLDVGMGEVDLAVLHHVLHFLEEPALVVEQAVQALAPGGRLLVVDFAPHGLAVLRDDHGHRHLGFAGHEVTGWCEAAGLEAVRLTHLHPVTDGYGQDPTVADRLTVSLWLATRPAESAVRYNQEVA
jgi:ArsR family transcriptional regulator